MKCLSLHKHSKLWGEKNSNSESHELWIWPDRKALNSFMKLPQSVHIFSQIHNIEQNIKGAVIDYNSANIFSLSSCLLSFLCMQAKKKIQNACTQLCSPGSVNGKQTKWPGPISNRGHCARAQDRGKRGGGVSLLASLPWQCESIHLRGRKCVFIWLNDPSPDYTFNHKALPNEHWNVNNKE